MALPKDAKHDFYSIAAGEVDLSENGLRRSELWAEAVFFLPAGELGSTLTSLFLHRTQSLKVTLATALLIRTDIFCQMACYPR